MFNVFLRWCPANLFQAFRRCQVPALHQRDRCRQSRCFVSISVGMYLRCSFFVNAPGRDGEVMVVSEQDNVIQGCCVVHPAACNALTLLRQEGEWVASEGTWDPETRTVTVLQPPLRSAINILQDGWHGWIVNQSIRGGPPRWSSRLVQYQSRWDPHPIDES